MFCLNTCLEKTFLVISGQPRSQYLRCGKIGTGDEIYLLPDSHNAMCFIGRIFLGVELGIFLSLAITFTTNIFWGVGCWDGVGQTCG